MNKEQWKEIKDWVGSFVSNKGRISSSRKENRPLYDNGDGYLCVKLSRNKVSKNFAVHRLVCQAFVPQVQGKNEVNHIDGNKKNNKASNLEWSTRSENIKHAYSNGLKVGRIGQKNGRAKLTGTEVNLIRRMYSTGNYTHLMIARKFGVSGSLVAKIITNKLWVNNTII